MGKNERKNGEGEKETCSNSDVFGGEICDVIISKESCCSTVCDDGGLSGDFFFHGQLFLSMTYELSVHLMRFCLHS